MRSYSRFRRFAVELLRISPVPASIGAKEERCELCRFWETNCYGGVGGPHCDGSASNCRRHAPRDPQADHDQRLYGGRVWPTTRRNDWCGEFERK